MRPWTSKDSPITVFLPYFIVKITPPPAKEVTALTPVVLNNVFIGLEAIPTYNGEGSIIEY